MPITDNIPLTAVAPLPHPGVTPENLAVFRETTRASFSHDLAHGHHLIFLTHLGRQIKPLDRQMENRNGLLETLAPLTPRSRHLIIELIIVDRPHQV